VLGQAGTTAPKPHGEEIVWENERRIFLAGELEINALRKMLREDGISVEVRYK